MNIAMISLYLPGGSKIGVGYQAHNVANALVRRGHRVTMFSPCDPGDDANYRAVAVPVGHRLRTFAFARNLRRYDFAAFDVLHAHTDDYWLWGPDKPPHVRTMHGSCVAEARQIPGAWEKLRMALLGASEVLSSALVADRTVCVSANTQRYYPWVRQVIYNGVDTEVFRPGDGKASAPTILFVGTYRNRKRGALLAAAFARTVLPAIPDARLWMVCSDAPPAQNVTVFGRIETPALADLYRRAWVFCLPSSYEGFGIPYVEAMASGTPVVATPNVGALEVLDRGRYGRVVEDDEVGPALLDLLRNQTERDRLARVGLARAAAFDLDGVAGQYERLYEELIDRRTRRSRARRADTRPRATGGRPFVTTASDAFGATR